MLELSDDFTYLLLLLPVTCCMYLAVRETPTRIVQTPLIHNLALVLADRPLRNSRPRRLATTGPRRISSFVFLKPSQDMATASKIQLSLEVCGEFHVPGISQESAAKASEVLQENHDFHHIFRNAAGFHSTYISSCTLWNKLFPASFMKSPSRFACDEMKFNTF